jgi:hypothetical protein
MYHRQVSDFAVSIVLFASQTLKYLFSSVFIQISLVWFILESAPKMQTEYISFLAILIRMWRRLRQNMFVSEWDITVIASRNSTMQKMIYCFMNQKNFASFLIFINLLNCSQWIGNCFVSWISNKNFVFSRYSYIQVMIKPVFSSAAT